jgi:predicted RNase H-like HicB family nuclease
MAFNYSMIIQWSENNKCFVVTLPEWGELCHTYGDTYEEALNNAKEVLKILIDSCQAEGSSLPQPKTFQGTLQNA